MSERTPGPWTLSGKQTIRAWPAWIGKTNRSNGAANAEFIVRACNVHDELVRELSHLVRLMEPMELDGTLNVPGLATLNGARAAIAKAKG